MHLARIFFPPKVALHEENRKSGSNFEIANMGSPSNQKLMWLRMRASWSFQTKWAIVEENNSDMGCDFLTDCRGADTDCDHFFHLWIIRFWYSEVNASETIHKGRVFNRRRKKRSSPQKWEWFLSSTYPLCVLERSTNRKPVVQRTCLGHSGIQSQLESYGDQVSWTKSKGLARFENLVTFETSFLVFHSAMAFRCPSLPENFFVLGCVSKVGKTFFFCEQWGGSICQHMQRLQNLRIVVESFLESILWTYILLVNHQSSAS